MIYTWRCKECSKITEVDRPASQYQLPPDSCLSCNKPTEMSKVITSSPTVPWEHLRNAGVFMDSHGNYPPRKID